MRKLEDLLVNKGLYDSVELKIDDLEEMGMFFAKDDNNLNNIDCFCIECNEKRIFQSPKTNTYEMRAGITKNMYSTYEVHSAFSSYLNQCYTLSFHCTRNHKHMLRFNLLVEENRAIKIGQYPSIADLSFHDKNKYKSVLKKNFSEYCTALGLFSHGVGIGAFVYLRRIIENLVVDTFDQMADNVDISKKDFSEKRFNDQITILADYLPTVLVSHKSIYGIMSKGIHELSEDECRNMFPIVKMGIELILDDVIAKKERAAKEKEFAAFTAGQTNVSTKKIEEQ